MPTPQCDAQHDLTRNVLLCHREEGHPGMHRDNGQNLYWHPGAPPLGWIELPQAREVDSALSATLGRLRGGIEL